MLKEKKLTLPKTVVLVGLMGAGKSSIGWRLAKQLGVDFHDSDQEVESAAGCKVADIFELWGESAFRATEKRVISRLLEAPPHILSTGDGSFIREDIRALIKEKAISLWLKADLDTLHKRVIRRDTRPLLLEDDPLELLSHLVDTRYPIYAEADIVVTSDDDAHEFTVGRVIDALETFLES